MSEKSCYTVREDVLDALYHAASARISELAADPKHLGAAAGYICILHTWGSEINFHPHIHAILLGGGLTSKNEWKDDGTDFFLPIQVVSKIFRGKYMDELTIPGVEFIRRFLMHVPPKRYVRIRHYGLLCSRTKNKKLALCRDLLGCQKYLSKLRDKDMPEVLKLLFRLHHHRF